MPPNERNVSSAAAVAATISSPTLPKALHTHIDSSEGLSARAIYRACRELAKEMLLEGDDAATEAVLRSALASLGLIRRTDNDVGGDLLYVIDQHGKWIEILEQKKMHHQQNDDSPQKYAIRLDADTCNTDDQHDQELLSWSILESAIQALTLSSSSSRNDKSNHVKQDPVMLVEDSDAFAIVGSIWWFYHLGILSNVSCSPIPCSPSLLFKCSNLLKGMPVQLMGDERSAHVTHDGLALLRVLLLNGSQTTNVSDICRPPPSMTLKFYAAGHGERTTITVGERLGTATEASNNSYCTDHTLPLENKNTQNTHNWNACNLERPDLWDVDQNLALLETNIDDMTAEHLAFAMEMLIQHDGVADCWLTPIIMKKGRGAHSLHCLCQKEQCLNVLKLIFKHCTTLGVRVRNHGTGLSRVALRRLSLTVPITIHHAIMRSETLQQHTVNCKVAFLGADTIVSIKAEFDQCRRISLATGGDMSLEQINEQAIQKARDMLHASRPEGSSQSESL